jgi:inosine-uridine nucleoside N-ribohydrolase
MIKCSLLVIFAFSCLCEEVTIKKTPIWLDCDPGNDDLLAITLAGHNEKLHLLGISTVAGNTHLHKVTRNALDALEVSGLEVDIVQGVSGGLFGPKEVAEAVHGETGLGAELPRSPRSVLVANGIQHIYNVIMNSEEKVTIVAIGPLTNIALLIQSFPDIRQNLEQIVIMGGACELGNVSPSAEFNIYNDPDAAHIVFHSKVKVVMVPLELTHTLLATEQKIEELRAMNTVFATSLAGCLSFYFTFATTYERLAGAPLHDSCAVIYAIDPQLLECQLMNVEVERHSQFNNGRTVCDMKGVTAGVKNVHVCTKINVDEAWKLTFDAIHKGNVKSKYGFPKNSAESV